MSDIKTIVDHVNPGYYEYAKKTISQIADVQLQRLRGKDV
jgi:hypothetical protein